MAFGSRGGNHDKEPLVPPTYALPELPWEQIAGRLEPITISILRFDARLETSGLAAVLFVMIAYGYGETSGPGGFPSAQVEGRNYQSARSSID